MFLIDLSSVCHNASITEAGYEDTSAVRVVSLSLQYKTCYVLLNRDYNRTSVRLRFSVRDAQGNVQTVREARVRYGDIRRISGLAPVPCDGTPSSSVWSSPRQTLGRFIIGKLRSKSGRVNKSVVLKVR